MLYVSRRRPSLTTGAQQLAPQRKFADNVRDMFDLRDVYHDVVNFSDANQDRLMRKWERIKGVFTAMRYGMQAPLSGAARGGDDALRSIQAYSRLEDPSGGGGGGGGAAGEGGAGGSGVGGGGGEGQQRRGGSEDRGTEVELYAGGLSPTVSPRGSQHLGGGLGLGLGNSVGGGGVGVGGGNEESLLGGESVGGGGGSELGEVALMPVAPLEREARFGSQATWRPGATG